VIEVSEFTVKLATLVAPNLTAVAPVKLVPVIVTVVPPGAGPELGSTLVTVGAGPTASLTNTHAAPASAAPPIRAVLAVEDSAVLMPNSRPPPLPVSFPPCCVQLVPERVNTQPAPTAPLSPIPPMSAVFPSEESATGLRSAHCRPLLHRPRASALAASRWCRSAEHPRRPAAAVVFHTADERRVAVEGERHAEAETGSADIFSASERGLLNQRVDPQGVAGAARIDQNQHPPIPQLKPARQDAPRRAGGTQGAVAQHGAFPARLRAMLCARRKQARHGRSQIGPWTGSASRRDVRRAPWRP
jgi:hypothetical protein